jgi:hypothetical protein
MKKNLLFLGFCFCWPFLAFGQPDWKRVAFDAFSMLDKEVADSLANGREEAKPIRATMERILAENSLTRAFIFGEKDAYFKEGMSRNFKETPKLPAFQMPERDANIVLLEKSHTALYEVDKRVWHWRNVQEWLTKHPDRHDLTRWVVDFGALDAQVAKKLKPDSEVQKWIFDKIMCDFVGQEDFKSLQNSAKKVADFTPEFLPIPANQTTDAGKYLTLPLPSEAIAFSFPTNGQFGFNPEYAIYHVGYLVFPMGIFSRFIDQIYGRWQLKIRWTSSKNKTITYTDAKFKTYELNKIYFTIPNNLILGEVYSLELLSIPKGEVYSSMSMETCVRKFRGQNEPNSPNETAKLQDEQLITKYFFRTSKYNWEQKRASMAGEIDWKNGSLTFQTDEPLDEIEMNGDAKMPAPVTFNLQSSELYKLGNALDAKDLYFYLAVPRVESLKNLSIDQFAAAELDNTLNLSFIQKVSTANFNAYFDFAEKRTRPILLFGDYQVPPYSSYNTKDSLVLSKKIPFIDRNAFENPNLVNLGLIDCRLFVGEFGQILDGCALLKTQLNRRIDERSQFFYDLEIRDAQRKNKPVSITLAEIKARELENLPESAKLILKTEVQSAIKTGMKIMYNRNYPGTNQINYFGSIIR